MATEKENQAEADKPMEERRREILKTARQYLVKDMDVNNVLPLMSQVFCQSDEEKITSTGPRTQQCQVFLEILSRSGDKAFDKFKEALNEVYPHLISTLHQADDINSERQKSANIRRELQCLEEKYRKVVDECDELRKQRDERYKLFDELLDKTKTTEDLNEQRKKNAVLEERVQNLETNLDVEWKRSGERVKDLKDLVRELQQMREESVKDKEKLEKIVTEKEDAIKKGEKELRAAQDKCDDIQKEKDRCSGEILQLQEDLYKRKNVVDEIRKMKIFVRGICRPFDHRKPTTDVIHYLTQNASEALTATRSSDGPGKATDILHNRKGETCGTEDEPKSWWKIDLGENHILFVTQYALTDRKNENSCLTSLQLKGSNDGNNWEKLSVNKFNAKELSDPFYGTHIYRVSGKMPPGYRYFKIVRTGKNAYGIYLSGIWLYGVLVRTQPLDECVNTEI